MATIHNYTKKAFSHYSQFFTGFTQSACSQIPALQEQQVSQVFRSVNTRKSTGPDGVPSKVPTQSMLYPALSIFTRISTLSLSYTQSFISPYH